MFLLAFDHRRPHLAQRFGIRGDPTPDETATIIDAKSVIFDGFCRAIDQGAPADEAGILVDEQFGAEVARSALAHGWSCAMPVERSGLDHFDFEYGDDFAAHIEAFNPTFSKILVRYNPDGNGPNNERSIAGLQRLSDWLQRTDRKLLLELIVPATPAQLDSVGGDPARYDAEIRPTLMRQAIAEIHAAGIEADLWKLEGIDRRDDCELTAKQARAGGRDDVGCVVLGQGADTEQVEHWLRTAASVPGYVGFAIGRMIWWDQLTGYLDGSRSRADAADQIATNYLRAISVYRDATSCLLLWRSRPTRPRRSTPSCATSSSSSRGAGSRSPSRSSTCSRPATTTSGCSSWRAPPPILCSGRCQSTGPTRSGAALQLCGSREQHIEGLLGPSQRRVQLTALARTADEDGFDVDPGGRPADGGPEEPTPDRTHDDHVSTLRELLDPGGRLPDRDRYRGRSTVRARRPHRERGQPATRLELAQVRRARALAPDDHQVEPGRLVRPLALGRLRR